MGGSKGNVGLSQYQNCVFVGRKSDMDEFGIRQTHDNLTGKLTDYIKAQYFAENDLLMNVADELLSKKGVIYQEPYIEVTRNYKSSDSGFKNIKLDEKRKNILKALMDAQLGVFKTPFSHQIKALEAYYEGKNVLVTTGTGSGKTECFLWPIMTDLIYEANYQEKSWKQEGIRALIMYPMNALVSDQLGRMRKIIGRQDDAYFKIASQGKPIRRPRFGMYTGRTPYPGMDDSAKNKSLAKLLKQNYIDSEAYNELMKIGRIPAKNLNKFVDNLSKGMQITSEEDSELYTRGEMQKICPDILITNYSMLEYMLMRPIENNFWDKTIQWLSLSEKNKLLLVIDEAHMYRGASGGEVSLLIRRLLDRLHINQKQLKCILTSASIPGNENQELMDFACNLTGENLKKEFVIVKEELVKNVGFKKGTIDDAKFFSSLSLGNLQSDYDCQRLELKKLQERYNWADVPSNEANGKVWLYENFSTNVLMKQVVEVCSKQGKPFTQIVKETFEEDVPLEIASQAMENILQLGTLAKSSSNKVLLGSKVHMMFKGLQGLFACTNPNCSHGHSGMGIKLGYITNKAIEFCPYCHSRMFELMMDRQCGTLFLRAFIDKRCNNTDDFEYLWARHNILMKEPKEVHLWVIPENRKDIFKLHKKTGKAKANSVAGYLDSRTGLLFKDATHYGESGYLNVLISDLYNEEEAAYTFKTCPNCGRDYNKITAFRTRGNEPFAHLVKEQFDSQVVKEPSLKNGGKKVLLFSDSRQRAATLARDMTIISDNDAGRQALFMAQKLLDESSGDKTLDLLYPAFLKVVFDNELNFFYGDEKSKFKQDLITYQNLYSQKKRLRFNRMRDNIGNPPEMFYQLLLKNISDYFRGIDNLGLGMIVLAEEGEAGEDVDEDLIDPASEDTGIDCGDIRLIYNALIQYLVKRMAVFPEISDDVRNSTLPYDRGGFGIDQTSKFPEHLLRILKDEKQLNDEQLLCLIDRFLNMTKIMEVPGRNHNRQYILGSRLQLKRSEHGVVWYKCDRCSGLSTFTLWGHCVHCGSSDHIHEVDERQLQRFSLWRTPVLEALKGKQISNITTEEHTAQLSYKDMREDVWVTTEKYELAFRNIMLQENTDPIDVLSCTTTMEVGIDIGSLTSVGLRNVPPMRENYQQRAGRAGRAGAAVSSIVTYTEDGPHDSWYFKHPQEIISGNPRIPWIDYDNLKLIKRHVNLILLQEYLRSYQGLDDIKTADFFNENNETNYINFLAWVARNTPLSEKRSKILIPNDKFDWESYNVELSKNLNVIAQKVKEAPFIYQAPTHESGTRSNVFNLLDVLFSEGMVPNYSFPRNIVHFWIEDTAGRVKESPERSLDIALSEYAPGRSLVVNKQTYISGGIYDYYTKFQKDNRYKAAEPWLELSEYKKYVQCCTNPLCGWFGVGQDKFEECPLCHSRLDTHIMIKPWGFTAREGKNIPETRESQEMSYVSEPSYSTLVSKSKMVSVGTAGYIGIENRADQDLVMVNKGPENKGFEMCGKCGAIEPNITNPTERNHRKRPYRVPYKNDDSMKCVHDYHNIYLGYEFKTDMMVMEIKLDEDYLNMKAEYALWLIPALTTFSEALSLAASHELDVEFSDIKSGYRIRKSGINTYADVYLYDSLSSGAGYAARVAKLIDAVLDRMDDMFHRCTCASSCPNCLQHFWNQRVHDKLDRVLGNDFLQFVRYGKLETVVPDKKVKRYLDEINQIAAFQGYNLIISEKSQKHYLNTGNGEKEIIIYPAMCNIKKLRNTNAICISDRMCRYAMADVWQQIESILEI